MSMIRKSVEDFKQHVQRRNWLLGAIATLLLIVAGLNYTLQYFGYEFANAVQNTTDIVIFTLVTFFVAAALNRAVVPWVNKILSSAEIESKLLFSKLVGGLFFGTAIVIFLWRLGVTGQNIALVLGFTATGFALSIRDIVISYLSWFVLLTKKPIRINDNIRIDGYEGRVKHIGTFYVILDENPETDLDFYKVPTPLFVQKPIRNFQRGMLQGIISVKTQSKSVKKKMRSIEKELDQLLSSQYTLNIDVEDKEFVIRVTYPYKLENKNEKRRRIAECLSTYLNE